MTALSIMLVVPFTALDNTRPAPLGWHMYAGSAAAPSIQVTSVDGMVEDRNLHAIVAHLRPEPDYTEPAARFICAHDEDIASIRFTRHTPALDREFLCKNL